jgi:hypothetical protein
MMVVGWGGKGDEGRTVPDAQRRMFPTLKDDMVAAGGLAGQGMRTRVRALR